MSVGVIRTNTILTIKGVFLSDLHDVSALYEKRPMTAREFAECVRSDVYTTYSEIPRRFTSVEAWPTITNLLCWICNRGFKTYPKFVPLNPERFGVAGENGHVEYDVEGNFCTWNCVVKYIRRNLHPNMRSAAERNACVVAGTFERRKILRIQPSPDHTQLRQYCGAHGMTEKQYDDAIARLNADYELTNYKLHQMSERA